MGFHSAADALSFEAFGAPVVASAEVPAPSTATPDASLDAQERGFLASPAPGAARCAAGGPAGALAAMNNGGAELLKYAVAAAATSAAANAAACSAVRWGASA